MRIPIAHDGAHSGDPETFQAAHEAFARLHARDPDNDTWQLKIAQALILQSRYHFFRSNADKGFPYTEEA